MDLRQLEYFQMVAKLSNISRAAERLHVAQPSISVAIQKLEEELGSTLFDRSQKKLQLTPEGKVFLKRTDAILGSLKEAVTEMHDYQGLARGSIKLGVPPMIGSFLFPQIFAKFRENYPGIDFIITEDGSLSVREALEQGLLDLAIIIMLEDSKYLDSIAIKETQIVACLPPHHPLAEKKIISFKDLRQEKFILLKEDTIHRKAILNQCNKCGYYPEIILSSSQAETIQALVANGLGISFLLHSIVKQNEKIVGVPLKEALKIKINLAWKKDKYISVASQAFIDFVRENYSIQGDDDCGA